MGVSPPRGRKPSLVGSVLDPPSPRGTVLLCCCSEKGGTRRRRGEREGVGLCVPVSSVCIDLNECVCVCVFPLRGGSERNATVPLHMSTPLRQLQGLLKTDMHPRRTHTHAETESLWNERKYQTTPAEYLSRPRRKAAH